MSPVLPENAQIGIKKTFPGLRVRWDKFIQML